MSPSWRLVAVPLYVHVSAFPHANLKTIWNTYVFATWCAGNLCFHWVFWLFQLRCFKNLCFHLVFLTFLTFWGRNQYRSRWPGPRWPPAAISVTAPKSQKSQKTQWKHRFLKHLSWKSQKTKWKHRFLAHHVTKTIVLFRFYSKNQWQTNFYCKNKFFQSEVPWLIAPVRCVGSQAHVLTCSCDLEIFKDIINIWWYLRISTRISSIFKKDILIRIFRNILKDILNMYG